MLCTLPFPHVPLLCTKHGNILLFPENASSSSWRNWEGLRCAVFSLEMMASVLWPPHAKSRLIGKDSDAGRDWGQEEKGTTEDEMA